MSITKYLLILAAVFTLSACQTGKGLVKMPEKVYVPVEKYVPIPEELTRDCEIEMPQERTVFEAVRVASERRNALLKCNKDKAAIRKISGQTK